MSLTPTIHQVSQPLDYVTPKRALTDRREFTAKTIFKGFITPRRKKARRSNDSYALIDVYGWPQMLASVILLVLSATDAIFTLIIIGQGGEELNPVMDYFLSLGTSEFMNIKMLIPTICIFFFVSCWNYRFFSLFRMCSFIFFSLAIYAVLVAYELVLLHTIYPNLFSFG